VPPGWPGGDGRRALAGGRESLGSPGGSGDGRGRGASRGLGRCLPQAAFLASASAYRFALLNYRVAFSSVGGEASRFAFLSLGLGPCFLGWGGQSVPSPHSSLVFFSKLWPWLAAFFSLNQGVFSSARQFLVRAGLRWSVIMRCSSSAKGVAFLVNAWPCRILPGPFLSREVWLWLRRALFSSGQELGAGRIGRAGFKLGGVVLTCGGSYPPALVIDGGQDFRRVRRRWVFETGSLAGLAVLPSGKARLVFEGLFCGQ